MSFKYLRKYIMATFITSLRRVSHTAAHCVLEAIHAKNTKNNKSDAFEFVLSVSLMCVWYAWITIWTVLYVDPSRRQVTPRSGVIHLERALLLVPVPCQWDSYPWRGTQPSFDNTTTPTCFAVTKQCLSLHILDLTYYLVEPIHVNFEPCWSSFLWCETRQPPSENFCDRLFFAW